MNKYISVWNVRQQLVQLLMRVRDAHETNFVFINRSVKSEYMEKMEKNYL